MTTLTSAPSFDRAQRVSRAVSIVSSVAMWATAVAAVAGIIALLFFFDSIRGVLADHLQQILASDKIPKANLADVQAGLTTALDLSLGKRLILVVALLFKITPVFFVLYYLQTLFAQFAHGQVFTDSNIGHIRMIGTWLVASVVASLLAQAALFQVFAVPEFDFDIQFEPLFYGAITYVAAYVMGEGRRISDENAGIV